MLIEVSLVERKLVNEKVETSVNEVLVNWDHIRTIGVLDGGGGSILTFADGSKAVARETRLDIARQLLKGGIDDVKEIALPDLSKKPAKKKRKK